MEQVKIFKGDSTVFGGECRLVVTLPAECVSTGRKAHFSLASITRDWDEIPSDGRLVVNLSASETALLPLGSFTALAWITDGQARRTVGQFAVKVSNSVEEVYQSLYEVSVDNWGIMPATADMLGGVKIGSGITVAADGTISVAGVTDYTELANKPKINGVELTGNRSLADIGAQPALASDGSDIPGGPYLPKSGGLINGDLSVGEEYDGSRNFKVGSPSGAKGFHVETTSDGCVLRVGGSEGSGGSVVVEDGGIGFASIKKGGKEVAIEEQLPYPIASAFMVDDDAYQLSDRTVNTFDASGSFVFPEKVGTAARDFVLVITAGETAPSVSFPGTGVTYVGEGADAFTAEANKTNIWWFSEVGANVFSVSHKAWSTITQGS